MSTYVCMYIHTDIGEDGRISICEGAISRNSNAYILWFYDPDGIPSVKSAFPKQFYNMAEFKGFLLLVVVTIFLRL